MARDTEGLTPEYLAWVRAEADRREASAALTKALRLRAAAVSRVEAAEALIRVAIRDYLAAGGSLADVAALMGVSRQAASQRYGELLAR